MTHVAITVPRTRDVLWSRCIFLFHSREAAWTSCDCRRCANEKPRTRRGSVIRGSQVFVPPLRQACAGDLQRTGWSSHDMRCSVVDQEEQSEDFARTPTRGPLGDQAALLRTDSFPPPCGSCPAARRRATLHAQPLTAQFYAPRGTDAILEMVIQGD